MGRRSPVALALGALVLGLLASVPANAQTGRSPSAEAGSSDWRVVVAGGQHTCGIKTTGRLFCWGGDDYGELGNGGPDADFPVPLQVAGGFTDWTQVAVGTSHTCARRGTGRLYCWGWDIFGQLGDGGTNTDQPSPVEVAGGFTNWTQVSAGDYHTCGRRSTGRLYCWGHDLVGQLGNGGSNTDQPTPVQVAGGATDWAQVDVGNYLTCARRSTGRLYCWGRDFNGQLGDGGTNTDRSVPTEVAGGFTDWAQVSAASHTCGRRRTGRLYCWGTDANGRLGNGGTNADRATPAQVAGGFTNWTQVAAGDFHTCARRSIGRIYCWGDDSNGQLGDGGDDTDWPFPREVDGEATDWTAVTAGWFHSCARIRTGRLFCWGADDSGQLGDGGTNTNWTTPSQVASPP